MSQLIHPNIDYNTRILGLQLVYQSFIRLVVVGAYGLAYLFVGVERVVGGG